MSSSAPMEASALANMGLLPRSPSACELVSSSAATSADHTVAVLLRAAGGAEDTGRAPTERARSGLLMSLPPELPLLLLLRALMAALLPRSGSLVSAASTGMQPRAARATGGLAGRPVSKLLPARTRPAGRLGGTVGARLVAGSGCVPAYARGDIQAGVLAAERAGGGGGCDGRGGCIGGGGIRLRGDSM